MLRSLLALALLLLPARSGSGSELRALETFDAAWSIVAREHFDPTFHGLDWNAVRDELRPRAAAAADRDELRRTIAEMLGRLGQSHFQLIPSEALGTGRAGSRLSPAGTPGLDLRWLEGEAVVVALEPGGPAERAGIRPGWCLVGLDGGDLEAIVAEARRRPGASEPIAIWKALLARLDGEVGTSVALELEDGSGARRVLKLVRARRAAPPYDPPGLPTFFPTWELRRVERAGRTVACLRFSNWVEPLLAPLEAVLDGLGPEEGLVLDLRGNTGGDSRVVTALGARFFERPTSLGELRMREGTRALTVTPRRGAHGTCGGPLAILVDGTTGSSSEVFAGGMQALGRARLFGTPTAGVALPASLAPLPNGDSLLHAVAEFTTPRGTVLEGDGLQPDVSVPLTRAAVAAGEDPVLAAALDWLAAEGRAPQSGSSRPIPSSRARW